MKLWVVDEFGNDVEITFEGSNGRDMDGNEYKLKDDSTIYSGYFDIYEDAFCVVGEFTPHPVKQSDKRKGEPT